ESWWASSRLKICCAHAYATSKKSEGGSACCGSICRLEVRKSWKKFSARASRTVRLEARPKSRIEARFPAPRRTVRDQPLAEGAGQVRAEWRFARAAALREGHRIGSSRYSSRSARKCECRKHPSCRKRKCAWTPARRCCTKTALVFLLPRRCTVARRLA